MRQVEHLRSIMDTLVYEYDNLTEMLDHYKIMQRGGWQRDEYAIEILDEGIRITYHKDTSESIGE